MSDFEQVEGLQVSSVGQTVCACASWARQECCTCAPHVKQLRSRRQQDLSTHSTHGGRHIQCMEALMLFLIALP